MRTLCVAAALLGSLASRAVPAEEAKASPARHLISGTVKVEACDETRGWFDPNKELSPGQPKNFLDPARKPAPPGQTYKILIRPGRENSSSKLIAELTSEPGGAFSLRLPAGEYCAVLDDKRRRPSRKTLPFGADLACMRARQRACDAVIAVRGPASGVVLARKQLCSWQDVCFPNRPHGPPAMD